MTEDRGAAAAPTTDADRSRLEDDERRRALEAGAAAVTERSSSAWQDTQALPGAPVREWTATGPAGDRTPAARHGAGSPAAGGATQGAGPEPGSAPVTPPATPATTVLPHERRPQRPGAPRDPRSGGPAPRPAAPTRSAGRGRRAKLALQRVDPWSVFVFSLVASLCLGVVLLVAVAALYLVLDVLGVVSSVNGLVGEVVPGDGPGAGQSVFTAGRVLGGAAVLAAVDVVLLTALTTLSALLYNLCASLTGGIEVVLGERD
jgi:hypothetical protein